MNKNAVRVVKHKRWLLSQAWKEGKDLNRKEERERAFQKDEN